MMDVSEYQGFFSPSLRHLAEYGPSQRDTPPLCHPLPPLLHPSGRYVPVGDLG